MGCVKEWLLRLLFPEKCMFCGAVLDGGRICGACRASLPYVTGVGPAAGFFSRSVTAVRYEDKVRDAAIAMKFHGRRLYADGFAELLAEAVMREIPGEFDVITWAPVSEKRLRERGYDQSELIARRLGELVGAPAEPLLRKTRHNETQSGIHDDEQRRVNVSGVYEALPGADIRGKRVLIVDDILTTGATLGECARALMMAGAEDAIAAAAIRARRG